MGRAYALSMMIPASCWALDNHSSCQLVGAAHIYIHHSHRPLRLPVREPAARIPHLLHARVEGKSSAAHLPPLHCRAGVCDQRAVMVHPAEDMLAARLARSHAPVAASVWRRRRAQLSILFSKSWRMPAKIGQRKYTCSELSSHSPHGQSCAPCTAPRLPRTTAKSLLETLRACQRCT